MVAASENVAGLRQPFGLPTATTPTPAWQHRGIFGHTQQASDSTAPAPVAAASADAEASYAPYGGGLFGQRDPSPGPGVPSQAVINRSGPRVARKKKRK